MEEFWQRNISHYQDERNSYLGSVFREGGLPYQLLRSEDSRFQDIFKRILYQLDAAKLMCKSTQDLVAQHLQVLPEAFKQETTITLVADMVTRLVHLVDEYSLTDNDEPSELLDKRQPNWQRLFPIPLDAQTGSQFLNGLLNSATRSRQQRKKNQVLSCQHTLVHDEKIRFRCLVQLADIIPVTLHREALSNARIEMIIAEGNDLIANIGVGIVQFHDDQAYIRPRSRASEFIRQAYEKPLQLLILQAGRKLTSISIPQSQLPVGDLPVGFREYAGEWLVVGQASFSYKTEILRIIIPVNAKINDSDARISKTQLLSDLLQVEFSGKLIVTIKDDNYHISNQNNVNFIEEVEIYGKTLPYMTRTGQPIYLGFPEIQCHDASTRLWIGGEPYSRTQCSNIYGIQTVKLKNMEGGTIFHKRLAILPNDFEVRIQTGDVANQGSISLISKYNFSVKINCESGVNHKANRLDTGKRFDFEANNRPPIKINLSLLPNLEASPIEFALPFPAKGALVFNADGGKLEQQITIRHLLGSRIILYPNITDSVHYSIELKAGRGLNAANYYWRYLVEDEPLEINLYELRHFIRELFSLTPDDLDARVELLIQGGDNKQVFEIMRYDCHVEANSFGISISSSGIERANEAKPVLMDLSDPKAAVRPLVARKSEGVNTGYFEYGTRPDDPCLIVPAKGSSLNFRARYIPARVVAPGETQNINSLQKAVALFHPKKRPTVFVEVLNQMSKDLDHSGWLYLIDLFDKFGHLPLSTFEVWKALVQHPQTVCVAAYRFENSEQLMTRLEQEFNVFWELFPIMCWQSAHKFFIMKNASLGLPQSLQKQIFDKKIKQLESIIPLYSIETRYMVDGGAPLNTQILFHFRNNIEGNGVVEKEKSLYQHLRQLHKSDKWPEVEHSRSLEVWYQKLNNKPLNLNIDIRHQGSVIIFPVFAAALAIGMEKQDEVIKLTSYGKFLCRKVIEFDRNWFNSVYLYCLSYFSAIKD